MSLYRQLYVSPFFPLVYHRVLSSVTRYHAAPHTRPRGHPRQLHYHRANRPPFQR